MIYPPGTFGILSREQIKEIGEPAKHYWIIEAEPHVIMHAKRVFRRTKDQYTKVRLLDNPEICRDLEWFMLRFPLHIQEHDRNMLNAGANKQRCTELIIQQTFLDSYVPEPVETVIPLRRYQSITVDLVMKTGSLLLGDDLGLGKTCQAIGVIAHVDARPALVVAPAHLCRQWRDEIKKFTPKLCVHLAKTGSPGELIKKTNDPLPVDVVIMSYHKLAGWSDTLAPLIKTIVFDEVAELRRTGTGKYTAAQHLANSATYRLGMSATPVYNVGSEIWSIVNVLKPDSLGSSDEFQREWCSYSKGYVKDPRSLGSHLRQMGIMLRRTRKEVGRELPPVQHIVQTVDSDLGHIEDVASSASELARIVISRSGFSNEEKMRAASELSWQLRQATGIAKAKTMADFTRMIVETGEPVVLFAWHREVHEILKERLADLKPVFITGDETLNQKDAAKEAFVSGKTDVLIMSLRSGAGLDGFQKRCKTVVFGELDWSPAVMSQCAGRVHRDGQEGHVFCYYLLSDSGSDPVVADTLGLKRQQVELIRDPNLDAIEPLQVDPDHVKKLAVEFLKQRGETQCCESA